MCGARLQIEVDNTKAVGEFVHHLKQTWRQCVYSGKGIHSAFLRVEFGIRASHFARLDVGPSNKPHVVIEEQIALGLAPTDKQYGIDSIYSITSIRFFTLHSSLFTSFFGFFTSRSYPVELAKIDIAKNIYIVNEYRSSRVEQWCCLLYAASCFEQSGSFVRNADVESEVIIVFKIVDYLPGKVMHVDYNTVNASRSKIQDDALNERLTPYPHQSFRHCVGERFKACAQSSRENHCLHHIFKDVKL